MEREQYQNQIKDLLQAVETLLKSNNALGERVAQLEKVAEAHEDLKVRYAKLEGYHNIWITVVNVPSGHLPTCGRALADSAVRRVARWQLHG